MFISSSMRVRSSDFRYSIGMILTNRGRRDSQFSRICAARWLPVWRKWLSTMARSRFTSSSCQTLWFLHLAAKARIDVVEYRDDAIALMPTDQQPVRITEIELRPHIVVAGEASEERIRKLVDTAHEHCFVANSLTSELTLQPTVEVRT